MPRAVSPDKRLGQLHDELTKTLLKRVKADTATAADLSVARQFLKDNNVDALPREGTPLQELAEKLPFGGVEDLDDADLRH